MGDYGVAILHSGFIPRLLAESAPEDSRELDGVNDLGMHATVPGWEGEAPVKVFPSREAAALAASRYASTFGHRGYRFEVYERTMVPKWVPAVGAEGD